MKIELNENKYYKSSDLALCAALCCKGYVIEYVDKQNPKRAIFWVKNNNKLEEIIKSYWSRSLAVDPIAFFNILKELKARIYAS
jgi:hypothetical protein